jgi:hypothetical protein
MTIEQAWWLIAIGAVSILVGAAMIRASSTPRSGRRRPWARDRGRGVVWALPGTTVGAVVITGAQWAVLSRTGSGAGWLAVLSLPAFLAAATVWRLLILWLASVGDATRQDTWRGPRRRG